MLTQRSNSQGGESQATQLQIVNCYATLRIRLSTTFSVDFVNVGGTASGASAVQRHRGSYSMRPRLRNGRQWVLAGMLYKYYAFKASITYCDATLICRCLHCLRVHPSG